jgi:hypothetical protein
MDTVGEFPSVADQPESGQGRAASQAKSSPPGGSGEFANIISQHYQQWNRKLE